MYAHVFHNLTIPSCLPFRRMKFAMQKLFARALVGIALIASGCEMLGMPDPAKEAAIALADGKAVGSACRHAGRALEDCYALNPKAQKAGVFTGWKEMNDYMREHKIDIVEPRIAREVPPSKAAKAKAGEEKSAATAPTQPGTEQKSKDTQAPSPQGDFVVSSTKKAKSE